MEIKDMTSAEIEERLSAIKTEMNAEEHRSLDEMLAEVEELETRKNELKAEAEKRAKLEEVVNKGTEITVVEEMENRTMPTMKEIRSSKEYADAFANYIKSNDDTECRALLSENGSGVVAVPTMVEDIVRTAWDKEGIMKRVRKSYLKGNIKVGFEISATGAVVHTEGGDAPTEETLVLGIVELVPQSIKKWITISDEVMDLRGEAFLTYVYNEVAYQIAKKAADELIASIEALTTGATSTAPNVGEITATTITVGTIAKAIAELSDEASNPTVIMNKSTWADFKEAQYANKFGVDPFEGLDVEFNNSLPTFTAASSGDTYVIVGDLGYGALANFPNGEEITFKFDDKSLAEKDLVKIVGREYVACEVVAPKAFVKVVK